MLINSSAQAFRESDPYEILIQQMLVLESEPKFRIEDEKRDLELTKSVMSDLDSRLSAFDSILEQFLDPLTHPFDSRASSLADSTAFSVKVTDEAAFGSHSVQVERLASTDTRLSDKQTSANTSIVGAVGSGTKSFDISVASPTEADPDNRETISVSVNITGSNDEEVLEEIASAINSAMTAAYDAGTINTDERAIASVINETSDTARLSIRAGQTGYSNRINFESDPNGLLSFLGIDSASVVSGDNGGQAVSVGTSEDTSDLTSRFILDGLTIYRNTNLVTDAIDGVSLTLKETATSPTEFSVTPDSSGIEDEIKDFIEKYNDILSYIKSKSSIDADTGDRGTLASDSTFTSLRFNLRADMITQVTGQPDDAPTQITDLGIEVNSDGSLSLTDADALIAAIETDPDAVRTLFSGSDGIATKLSERLDDYMGFNGFIRNRTDLLDTQIRDRNRQISDFDDALGRREERLRGEFARLQESITLFQGQQFSLSAFL